MQEENAELEVLNNKSWNDDRGCKDGVEKKASTKYDRVFLYKLGKQCALVGLWIGMGYGRGIAGPALPDLKDKFDTNYEIMARVVAMTSFGFVSGCFIGGVMHERFHKHTDIIMAAAIIAGGISGAAIPWMPTVISVVPLFIISGFAGALQNAGGNTMVIDLWGESAGPAVFTLHFGFGVGAFLGPLIAQPYLSAKIADIPCSSLLNMTSSTPSDLVSINASWPEECFNGSSSIPVYKQAQLEIPFAIEGLIDIFFTIIFAIYWMKGPPKGFPVREGAKDMKGLFNPGQCFHGNNGTLGCVVLLLLFLYYIQAVGGELAFSQFLFAFATDSPLKFTSKEATKLTSIFFLCHLSGRGLGALLSKFIPINIIIGVDILGLLVSTGTLALFGYDSRMVLWVCTGCIGLLCSFIYPGGMVWANMYMKVNSMVVMITMFGGAAGYVIYTYLGGFLIEYVSMKSFLYLEAAYAVILMIVFVLLVLLGRFHMKMKEETEDCVEADVMMRTSEECDEKESHV